MELASLPLVLAAVVYAQRAQAESYPGLLKDSLIDLSGERVPSFGSGVLPGDAQMVEELKKMLDAPDATVGAAPRTVSDTERVSA
jgi:hypothetical protein